MGTPTYDLISSTTLTSTTASVTISSLPSTYRDLVFVTRGQGSTSAYLTCRFNGDDSAIYNWHSMMGDGSLRLGASSASGTSFPALEYPQIVSSSNDFIGILNVFDYSVSRHTGITWRVNRASGATGLVAGRYASLSTITSVSFTLSAGLWQIGSTFDVYGIEA